MLALIFGLLFTSWTYYGGDAPFGSRLSPKGAEIFGHQDEFNQRLGEFDRAARMKNDRSISEGEFLKFVKASGLTLERLASRNAMKSSFRLTLNCARSLIPTRLGTITRSGSVSVERKCARDRFYF